MWQSDWPEAADSIQRCQLEEEPVISDNVKGY